MRRIALCVTVAAALTVAAQGAAQTGEPASTRLRDAIAAQQAEAADAMPDGASEITPPLQPEDLDDLVAPVALYPDALLAQVLVAATYPLQIAKADQLIDASAEMSDSDLNDALARQDFDPSVLVLMSGFPTVVGRMADDLDWTERLGMAMVDQDDDVLDAVQRMRARAEAEGNLASNQAQVIEKDSDQIYIKPADPKVVYVPSYDPVTTYTTPTTYSPGTTSGLSPLHNPLVAGALAFGGALLVEELFGNDDHDDKHDNDWNRYWNGARPIDWRDRQFYPRPQERDRHAWSRERDQDWDRNARRWRRDDAARQRERRDILESVNRNAAATTARMRDAAREEATQRFVTDRRAAATRQQAAQRRAKAEAAAEKQQQAKAAAEKERQAKARARNEQQAKAAAEKDRQAKAAAEKDRQAEARARNEQQAKAAAEKEPQAKVTARKEQQAKAAAEKERQAKAAAEKDRQAKARARNELQAKAAAEKERQAKVTARKEQQAKAAAEKERQAKAAAEKDRQAKARGRNEQQAKTAAEKERQAKAAAEKDRQAKVKAHREQQQQAARPDERPAKQAKKKCTDKGKNCKSKQ